jgi:hypothetical protein
MIYVFDIYTNYALLNFNLEPLLNTAPDSLTFGIGANSTSGPLTYSFVFSGRDIAVFCAAVDCADGPGSEVGLGLCRPLSRFKGAALGAGLIIFVVSVCPPRSSSALAPSVGERRTGAEGRGRRDGGTGEDGEGDSIILGGGDSKIRGDALPLTLFSDSFAFRWRTFAPMFPTAALAELLVVDSITVEIVFVFDKNELFGDCTCVGGGRFVDANFRA